jgi:hypothetical protein
MYATKTSFAGQRVALTRAVVIKIDGALFAATTVAIDDDRPTFAVVPHLPNSRTICSLVFFETKTEADLERMPNNAWTWPPRV